MSGTYDEKLLAEAPLASKKDRQEGYNLDLLEPERTSSPPVRAYTPATGVVPPEAGASFPPPPREGTPRLEEGQTDFVSTGGANEFRNGDEYYSKPSKPWYKTKTGIIIIIIILLVIIGAAVGGGVAGSHSGKSNNNVVHATSSTSTSPSTNIPAPVESGTSKTSTGAASQATGTLGITRTQQPSSTNTAPGGSDTPSTTVPSITTVPGTTVRTAVPTASPGPPTASPGPATR
ncbi:uncharacterized protein EI90DRAFT_3123087 [Cantharellus anzutake]|uniref:uncharacterized protein n=1 Tax=Cantharellus anzutake TaxID=1750568 RepID=UPI001902C8D1|nr:uncharacterized protein EI90DRAFT_3123087 [Cantharellus anzutake]KAF8332001.1 hypothetical protein EI90DRAFT_3123087 [Cantharellus anzutake]